MNKFFHSVYLDEDKCKGCINCIKRCPTQAIRVRNGKARIIKEFCIDCGECVRHCPHHAKLTKQDHFDLVRQFEYSVALPAPSLYGQFNNLSDINIVLTALKRIGFDDVYEVSGAAELVSGITRDYIQQHPEKWPLINTACPSVVRLIRVRFPNLLPHLLPVQPPVEVAAKLARKAAMEKTGLPEERIGIFFISPCPSKVTAQKSPLGEEHSALDGVLAIKDIYPLLLAQMNEAERHTEDLSISGKIGVGWGISGGESAGIFTDSYLAADGIENVIRVLEDLEDEKLIGELKFIELNSCSGGCVGGVLNIENPFVAKAKMKRLNKYLPVSVSHPENLPDDIDLFLSQDITFEPVYQLGENVRESMENLNSVDEFMKILPALDCGACGAPTCKALAEDIVRGHAKREDCIYLLRDYYAELKNSQLLEECEK
ncbi:MAG: [Fe-Fe] hydrogenase large subunit C-terminal domain-containing protein [Lachnospiraceae bacterium]